MNLREFKAWFEGFTEGMEGTPNKKQWERIRKRVGEITSEPTSYPVFVDRYRDYWHPIRPMWGGDTVAYSVTKAVAGIAVSTGMSSLPQNAAQPFDCKNAFLAVGRNEFASMGTVP